jgi:hypothetical protein
MEPGSKPGSYCCNTLRILMSKLTRTVHCLPFAALSTLQSSHREKRGLQQDHLQVYFLYYLSRIVFNFFFSNKILVPRTCFGIINLIKKLDSASIL